MRRLPMMLAAAGLFGIGYLTGLSQAGNSKALIAATQPPQQSGIAALSDDTLVTYKKAFRSTNDLSDILRAESLYAPATEGLNYFALSVGGIDVVRDLEEGRGVDPETFAALYADRAVPEISQNIDRDESGRVRYKGTVVRLYSRDQLKEMFRHRDQLEVRARRASD
ncbi:MAG: hypothetical protein R3C19_05020 [Planctomycetaceae bacterium]